MLPFQVQQPWQQQQQQQQHNQGENFWQGAVTGASYESQQYQVGIPSYMDNMSVALARATGSTVAATITGVSEDLQCFSPALDQRATDVAAAAGDAPIVFEEVTDRRDVGDVSMFVLNMGKDKGRAAQFQAVLGSLAAQELVRCVPAQAAGRHSFAKLLGYGRTPLGVPYLVFEPGPYSLLTMMRAFSTNPDVGYPGQFFRKEYLFPALHKMADGVNLLSTNDLILGELSHRCILIDPGYAAKSALMLGMVPKEELERKRMSLFHSHQFHVPRDDAALASLDVGSMGALMLMVAAVLLGLPKLGLELDHLDSSNFLPNHVAHHLYQYLASCVYYTHNLPMHATTGAYGDGDAAYHYIVMGSLLIAGKGSLCPTHAQMMEMTGLHSKLACLLANVNNDQPSLEVLAAAVALLQAEHRCAQFLGLDNSHPAMMTLHLWRSLPTHLTKTLLQERAAARTRRNIRHPCYDLPNPHGVSVPTFPYGVGRLGDLPPFVQPAVQKAASAAQQLEDALSSWEQAAVVHGAPEAAQRTLIEMTSGWSLWGGGGGGAGAAQAAEQQGTEDVASRLGQLFSGAAMRPPDEHNRKPAFTDFLPAGQQGPEQQAAAQQAAEEAAEMQEFEEDLASPYGGLLDMDM